MAVGPRISLASQTPDIGATFSNALLNVQRGQQIEQQKIQAPFQNRMLEAQTIGAEQGNVAAAQTNDIRSLAVFGAELGPAIQAGDLFSITSLTQQRIQQIDQRGGNSKHSRELLAKLQDPNLSDQQKVDFTRNAAQQMNKLAVQTGAIKAGASGGLASAKTEIMDDGTVVQALPGGDVQVRNPAGEIVTGQDRIDTLKRSSNFKISQQQKESDIAVSQAERTATATQRVKRASDITTELSGKSRQAKRGAINLNQAANLIEKASQGLTGRGKVLLGRVFPGIDVRDEGALEQSLKLLAMDELQKFTGPTTDFEFTVTEDIAGSLGTGQSANRARVASLRRAGWFATREFEQFQRHIKSGGDADAWGGFNFGEEIKTKKGVFTLQVLQDAAVNQHISIEEAIKRLNK